MKKILKNNSQKSTLKSTIRPYNEDSFFDNRILSVEEVAVFLGFAPQTIKNWVAQRKIPFIRLGRKTRFCPKSIQAWVKQKEFKSCQ